MANNPLSDREPTMQNDTVTGFWLSPQQRHLWRLQATETSQPFRVIGVVAVLGPKFAQDTLWPSGVRSTS